jgi:hypothetical protein
VTSGEVLDVKDQASEVLVLKFESGHRDPVQAWCFDAVWSVIDRVQAIVRAGDAHRTLIVFTVVAGALHDDELVAAEAAVQALRGFIQSIAAEVDPGRLWCSLAIVSDARPEDHSRLRDYLLSSGARFGLGATIDAR